MLGKLVPCGGGVPILLLKPLLVLGRRSDCDIPISCSSVSGRHCQLEWDQGTWWVIDLQSKNGTTLNGQRGARLRIAPSSILAVGRQRMVVDYRMTVKPVDPKSVSNRDDDLALELLNESSNSNPKSPTNRSGGGEKAKSRSDPKIPMLIFDEPTPSPSNAPTGDLGKLVPCGGGVPIPLRTGELILGRGSDCDIRIRFPSVSSRHCKLHFDQGYWMVEDLHSTNGTWVDGDRCLLQCLLPDSVLALDKHRYTIHYTPRSDGAPPEIKRLFSQSLLEKAGLAGEFTEERLGRLKLPDDDLNRPKRYNLLDSDDESL